MYVGQHILCSLATVEGRALDVECHHTFTLLSTGGEMLAPHILVLLALWAKMLSHTEGVKMKLHATRCGTL